MALSAKGTRQFLRTHCTTAKQMELALATSVAGQRVVAGRILIGDQFVSDPHGALRRRLQDMDGLVVEGETRRSRSWPRSTACLS